MTGGRPHCCPLASPSPMRRSDKDSDTYTFRTTVYYVWQRAPSQNVMTRSDVKPQHVLLSLFPKQTSAQHTSIDLESSSYCMYCTQLPCTVTSRIRQRDAIMQSSICEVLRAHMRPLRQGYQAQSVLVHRQHRRIPATVLSSDSASFRISPSLEPPPCTRNCSAGSPR